MSHSLPTLITSLLEPARYPDTATSVDLIETHTSWVLLAGEFAYKIKKSITLPFLDYSTLERRLTCCQAEMRLNRRFAPDVYLGVVEILGAPQQPIIGALGLMKGKVIEYAVKMKRFAESGRLDRVCKRGELTPFLASQLVDAIISFHKIAAVAGVGSHFGTAESLLPPAIENITTLQTLLPLDADQQQLSQLASWTQSEYKRLAPRFVVRKEAGHVRECHGDLHLGNIALIDEQVTLFDCIDFNEEFRWIDVASEIAFTYIDLLDHDQPGLACWFLSQWLSRSGDYDAVPVLRFYAVYRALVRAKVAAISAMQQESDFAATQTYLTLAKKLAVPLKPNLTITHGLSGSGKTIATKQRLLADKYGATLCLRSDVERKRIFGLAEDASSNSPLCGGIYGPGANKMTYSRLLVLTALLLNAGWSVIVDAAFLQREERDDFRELATKIGADFSILAPQASHDQLADRITSRLAEGGDASEATLSVLKRQQEIMEPLDANEQLLLASLNT